MRSNSLPSAAALALVLLLVASWLRASLILASTVAVEQPLSRSSFSLMDAMSVKFDFQRNLSGL